MLTTKIFLILCLHILELIYHVPLSTSFLSSILCSLLWACGGFFGHLVCSWSAWFISFLFGLSILNRSEAFCI